MGATDSNANNVDGNDLDDAFSDSEALRVSTSNGIHLPPPRTNPFASSSPSSTAAPVAEEEYESELTESFNGLSDDERTRALTELFTRFCPECGKRHAACVCELDIDAVLR